MTNKPLTNYNRKTAIRVTIPQGTTRCKTLAETYKTFPKKNKVSSKQYGDIIRTVSNLMMRSMVESGATFKLPNGLGKLGIKKRRRTSTSKVLKSWATGKPYKNVDSQEYYARFDWDKKKTPLKFKSAFKFYPTGTNKVYLADQIINNNTMLNYYEL